MKERFRKVTEMQPDRSESPTCKILAGRSIILRPHWEAAESNQCLARRERREGEVGKRAEMERHYVRKGFVLMRSSALVPLHGTPFSRTEQESKKTEKSKGAGGGEREES